MAPQAPGRCGVVHFSNFPVPFLSLLESRPFHSRNRDGHMQHTNGKGDRRTRRGKIYNGSYGKTRPHRGKKAAASTSAATKPASKSR